ncbi:MAG TPA: putative inorganic carbon transporter subunit DabA, partial [Pelobium sp.]|nr:putative inorganic carbon transporter subunit DabA [Pelobium sp.]
QGHESFCETSINSVSDENANGISLEEKVRIVKSVIDVLGCTSFAPLMIFSGHASHSANNPFASSLDCGACAASPGRHNARMLAKIANEENVKTALRTRFGIQIPQNTLFLGAEHNTATDEIILFDSQAPKDHLELIKKLKLNLAKVQSSATQERLGTRTNSIAKANYKSTNWAETRPEWGLAKNAAFIIAPRSVTKNLHLGGRSFLNSYNWELDKEGKVLEGIMQGPMVVGQWINSQYYFSTVNNDLFGGGSKITQNVTSKLGVVQGNGGDLKFGLPLQSVKAGDNEMYHQPLRLSVVIQAPKHIVSEIVERNEDIKTLINNEWLYLMVMDPLQGNEITIYQQCNGFGSQSQKEKNPISAELMN